MRGMNADTGKVLEGIEHLEQSIRDILSTPIGTRVMRHSYGSRLAYLVDRPMNANLIANIQAAVVEALTNYEPRIKLSRVTANTVESGQVDLTIEGFYVPDSRVIRLENIKTGKYFNLITAKWQGFFSAASLVTLAAQPKSSQ